MAAPESQPDVRAAGVVTFRPGREVLLVHRPKYDDWSFPKGKLERWEHPTAAAVREVAEETGLHVRLGPPLPDQRYPTGRRMKTVHYWTGRTVADDDVSHYRPNDEIDDVRWVPVAEAADLLTYEFDRETLAHAKAVRRKTHALVVLRHAVARSRRTWRGDDRDRPLLRTGEAQADRLVPVLAAYDAAAVVSSASKRCVQTVQPYVETTGYELDTRKRLSEEGATEKAVERIVEDLLSSGEGAVICTHRPVLPLVYDAIGLRAVQREPELAPGEMLVVHARKGVVVAVERHRVGP
ncbi:8-oxo-dGTP diphosphatase [Nocardioides thalensis]|uniref:8-oxo-dGTP diphosphatase n=1 Tax=Nocardioides thalensis TaxID=1914755 RepID=A0A853C7C9_9ACTN|nr:8-oxo-dGTP diphosphatase [Nocardioides thalensis]